MNTFRLQNSDDIGQLVTSRIMTDVFRGETPWNQEMIRYGLPANALSGQCFTGINILLLWQAAHRAGLTSHFWLTGDDLRSLGGRIRQGHRPATVVRYRPSLSLFRVINLEQCEGLPKELPTARLSSSGSPEMLLAASGIPVVYQDRIAPIWRPLHNRIELPSMALSPEDLSLLTALLIQATGHPERLARYGINADGNTPQEQLIADLGRAFLSAQAGMFLPGPPLWSHTNAGIDDPWFLFRAATAAGKAAGWLNRRLASARMDDIGSWQQHAGALMSHHYGLLLQDTTLILESVARKHLANGTTPRHAVNALARLYDWPRIDGDNQQETLFTPELNATAETLARFTLDPSSVRCQRIDNRPQIAPEIPDIAPTLLLPPPEETTHLEAANDGGDPGPDTPPGQQAIAPETEDDDVPNNLAVLPWVTNRGRPNPHKDTFLRQFREIAPHENRWTIFSDFMHMSAAALHNQLAFSQKVEDDYLRRIRRYDEEDRFRFQVLFQTLIDGMDFSASDFLGSIYMELGLGNKHNGQYFTPYSVSYMMARLLMADKKEELENGKRDFISISDPACGASGMIIAFANAMLEAGYNPQKQLVAFCTDNDSLAAMMCYIQLSLCGIPAVVTVGNSLSMEIRQQWRTPFWMLQGWDFRWAYEQKRQAKERNAA